MSALPSPGAARLVSTRNAWVLAGFLAVSAHPAVAAERATLHLRGSVPPTVGVSLQIDPFIPVSAGGGAAAVATINGTGNSLFQLLLMTDTGADMMATGTTLMFNGTPLTFSSGVAMLNGMRAAPGGMTEQNGELLVAARTPVLSLDGKIVPETYTLVVRAP